MLSFLHKFKDKFRYNVIIEWYNMLELLTGREQRVKPTVMTIEETIEHIISEKSSVSRFGDGEMLLIGGEGIRFQHDDDELSKRLAEVLTSDLTNHIVCISDAFVDLDRYNRRARRFWRAHFYLYGDLWDKYLKKGKRYGNTFITRPYIDFSDRKKSVYWFNLLKQIWSKRDIVFIEGEKSRLGIGNDLFDNVESVGRILCRSKGAFDQYDVILQEACKLAKNSLILIALGPTATVLAYDLCKLGYQAIDVGHIDIEYEWLMMGAKHKVNIKSKYVNEVIGGDQVVVHGEDLYQRQILKKLF
ncbi:SP_1767 family glycosyltransferase [Sphingobacterium sp. UGAL515B_05]|uniref:SP_1767 family glycosyltransferase n=1 Tax=Sphingobacterium sp. UGAL515B_05 TaxID=2986767 RepID=UPI0029552650|nr:SP_1767 family glycosyltransferase [Sphingobacterium sp. UGAL515B_05]WON96065.1 SP_1767 family glycosyltransferase [Sphingobacterium sp. UGAL515B_05]